MTHWPWREDLECGGPSCKVSCCCMHTNGIKCLFNRSLPLPLSSLSLPLSLALCPLSKGLQIWAKKTQGRSGGSVPSWDYGVVYRAIEKTQFRSYGIVPFACTSLPIMLGSTEVRVPWIRAFSNSPKQAVSEGCNSLDQAVVHGVQHQWQAYAI
jgi:hypothetical protein